MTECECGKPPCQCKQFQRDTICEHKIRGTDNKLKLCGNEGTLREDCNYFFEHRLVLCDNHLTEHKARANRRCGICGSSMRECCC